MKKSIISILVSSLLLTNIAMADSTKTLTTKEVTTQAKVVATQEAKNSKVKLIDEAIKSLNLSAKALLALENKNSDEAKKDIELALGKLEAILAAEHTPKLLPIENRVVIKNFEGSAKDVEIILNEVKELLSEGKVQEAGELLITLQSEIDVTVVSLPLVSYPDALKLASKYLIEEKPDKAKEVLKLALNTFTEVQQIIPIPIINTVELVSASSDIAKENQEQALKYLSSASDELDKAEKLGYLSKSTTTYKQLHEMIKNVEKEVKGPNKAEKLFQELGEKLKEFKEKIFSSSDKEKK
jgi:ribonuclease HII